MRALYPPKAWVDGVAGRATISCTVLETGRLTGCTVVEETPPDQGFGEAALKATELFILKPLIRDGVQMIGPTARIPIKFPQPPE